MRFMILVKADERSEAGLMPSAELMAAMGKFNEDMVKAGVMLAGERLQPSSKGGARRVLSRQAGRHRRVVRGDQGAHRGLLDDPGRLEGPRRSSGRRARPSPMGRWRFARCSRPPTSLPTS